MHLLFNVSLQEDEVLFCRTLYGVMRNIAHLGSRKNSQTWGPDAWKKVIIVLFHAALHISYPSGCRLYCSGWPQEGPPTCA